MNQPVKPPQNDVAGPKTRHKTTQVMVGNVAVGGGAPIVGQAMTNTDTADGAGTGGRIAAVSRAGSEKGRSTGDRPEAAAAGPALPQRLQHARRAHPPMRAFPEIDH